MINIIGSIAYLAPVILTCIRLQSQIERFRWWKAWINAQIMIIPATLPHHHIEFAPFETFSKSPRFCFKRTDMFYLICVGSHATWGFHLMKQALRIERWIKWLKRRRAWRVQLEGSISSNGDPLDYLGGILPINKNWLAPGKWGSSRSGYFLFSYPSNNKSWDCCVRAKVKGQKEVKTAKIITPIMLFPKRWLECRWEERRFRSTLVNL